MARMETDCNKEIGSRKMTKNRSSFAFPFIESFDNSHLYFRVRSVRENGYDYLVII